MRCCKRSLPPLNCHWVLWCCKRSLSPSNCHWVLWCCKRSLSPSNCHWVLWCFKRSLSPSNCHWVLRCCKRSLAPSNCHWVLWCCKQPFLQNCHCVLLHSGRSLPLADSYRVSHSHHENDFYIKTGTCESHFNVSLTARRIQSQESVHKPQLLKRKERQSGESNRRVPLTSLTPYRWARPAYKVTTEPGTFSCRPGVGGSVASFACVSHCLGL